MKNLTLRVGFYSIIILASIILIEGCAVSPQLVEQERINKLKAKIDERFNDSLFASAHWGALIKSLKTGETWYSLNSSKMFMPASNEKILTGASALLKLGPEFTFDTYLCYRGNIVDSALDGDLVVFGNGDPTLYDRFFRDPRDLFNSWANMLLERGIKKITGDIIGDDEAFGSDTLGFGWSFDGLDSWYSAEVGALQLNENYIDLKIIPPKMESDSVKIIPNLPSKFYKIINNMTVEDTGRTQINFTRELGTNNIIFTGLIKRGSREVMVSPTLTYLTQFYVTVLKEVFENRGIKVEGKPVSCRVLQEWNHKPEDFQLIDDHKSAPLKDILTGMLKRSQNLYAETLVRTLGWKETGLGSFKNGKKIVEEELESFGVKPGSYRYMDGSGLSRYDYVSPEQLTAVLTGMWKGKEHDIWYNALPIAGTDGTLSNRMRGTAAAGNVHAKTGTISNVRSLSGYVTTADGEPLVFSFIVNGHLQTAKETEDLTDSVLEMLAGFTSKGN